MKKWICSVLLGCLTWPAGAEKSADQKAADLAEAGWNYYYFAEFKKAEKTLKKASELNPKDQQLKYGYAKTLYRNGKYEAALEQLEATAVKPEQKDEKALLTAMSHYAQDRYDQASGYFSGVVQRGGQLSSVAQSYLDQMVERKKRFRLNGQLGLMYDSRVVDEDLLATTDGSDGRLFLASDLQYRLKKWRQTDVRLRGEVANYFSFNDDHSLADPLLIALRGQFDRQVQIAQRDYGLRLTPGLELIWLDIANSGSRGHFLTTPIVEGLLARAAKDGRQHSFYGQLRYEIATEDSLENTNSDIDGLNFRGGWRFAKQLKGQRLWQNDVYGKFNLAEGDNIAFFRIGGQSAYLMPWRKFNLGFVGDLRLTSYPNAVSGSDEGRTDIYFSAAAVGSRSLGDLLKNEELKWLRLEARAGFTLNLSNFDDRDYDRMVVASLLKGNWSF